MYRQATEQQIRAVQSAFTVWALADGAERAERSYETVSAVIRAYNRLTDACLEAGMPQTHFCPERWAERFL